jgi:hypothetical protein
MTTAAHRGSNQVARTREDAQLTDKEYIAALNRDLMIANATREDAEAERDRALRTITEIEDVLRLYKVPITSPLSDAILEILAERAGETGR